jgi:iron complex outermembrane recepter protein
MKTLHTTPSAWLICTAAGIILAPFATDLKAQAIEEIIVTAQKREQSLQEVTAAVTVVGTDRLQAGQINNIEDLSLIVPNLYLGNDFNMAKLFIRGIGANTSTTGSEPGVVLHVDGVVVSRAEAQLTSLFDLQRVEVLRGPQGSLYGRNAVGGSVNLITNKPSAELEGYVRATAGDYDLLGIEAAIGGPLSHAIRGRLAYKSETRGGFGVNPVTGNDVDDLNRRMVRGQLQFLPTDNFDFTLSGEYYHQNDASRALKFRRESYPGVARLVALGIGGYAVDKRDVASEFDPASEIETWAVTGTFNWRLNDILKLVNITGYRELDGFITQDLDISAIANSLATTGGNTTVQRRDVKSDQFSTEFQLNFQTERLSGVVGLFYFEEDQAPVDTVGLGPIFGQDHILNTLANPSTGRFPPIGATGLIIDGVAADDTNPVDLAFPLEMCNTYKFIGGGIDNSNPPVPKRVCLKSDLGTEAWAIFGQVNVNLGDSFVVKVGGRYNSEKVTSANPSMIIARNGLGPILITTREGTSVSRTFDDFTPEFGLEWRAAADLMAYYTYSEGFKAGAGENAAGSTVIVDPEEVKNHEIGLKSTWLNGRLAVNIAAFTYDLKGQQINKTIAGGPAGFSTIFENAAQTSADGAEIEFFGALTDVFRISGSLAWLDSKYDDFLTKDPLDPRNVSTPPNLPSDPATDFDPNLPEEQLAGNPTRNSPEWTANLHAEWDIGRFTLMGDVSYRDDVFFTEFNRLLEGQDSYTMVDLNLRYTSSSGQITTDLWVKNLTDEDAATSTFALATARTIGVTYMAPRIYGFTLGYRF